MEDGEIAMTKPVFACVLKLGGDYIVEHVRLLAAQVRAFTTIDFDFICFTDYPGLIDGVITIPLENNWPGWWSVPEVFRNVGPTIVVGVDTMIRGNIDGLFKIAIDSTENDFWMIRAFRPPVRTISGIMVWNGDWSWLYKKFNYELISRQLRGEEDYTNQQLKRLGVTPKVLQDSFPGIYSYKRHCLGGIPADCSVLVFHGKPRPFDVPELWQPIVKEFS